VQELAGDTLRVKSILNNSASIKDHVKDSALSKSVIMKQHSGAINEMQKLLTM
jgi:hypothetical protein